MASSPPPSCFSSLDPINCTVTVTERQFKAFHSVDRTLYTRLVVALGREAKEAMQVVAYIMWLEKIGRDQKIVARLSTASEAVLQEAVGEAVVALACMESGQVPPEGNPMRELRLTQRLSNTNLSFPYLLHNRLPIMATITKLIDDVCIRAFSDIVQRVEGERERALLHHRTLLNPNPNPTPMVRPLYFDPSSSSSEHHLPHAHHAHHAHAHAQHQFVAPPPQQHPPPPPVATHNNNANINWCGGHPSMLRGLEVGSGSSSSPLMRRPLIVPPDERTIFLTFSKGYFISEPELRDYFSRRYGDVIEEVYMQEVEMTEQPLYARLVVRWNAVHLIDRVLEGRVKVKFSINGKHVWARKYVRKTTKSPPNSPSASPSSSSSSPHPNLL